ncbi:hypothetical protein LSG23_20280 (plasmid) [Bacillus velezensis]|uniref:hypothetical protein n=1 Tax=Bacillus velezensis TaxID=492670 RepID=UPI000987F93D|nr:hypothetical protein [Bacillus velezensis]AQS42454.1 hypothetical protein BVH55_00210 [Bacillus velezensis]WNR83256.1 hypothetical protein RP314_20570 [Bacillus velezensis]
MESNNSANWIVIGLVGVGMLMFCALPFISYHGIESYKDNVEKKVREVEEKEKKEKEEVLKNGKEVDALIIDKSKESYSSGSSVSVTPIVIGGSVYSMPTSTPGIESTNYYFKLYVDDKNYDISVPSSLFNEKSIGTHIKIKLYKDKIEIL